MLKADALEAPFKFSLGKDESTADNFIVIDANEDTKTWKAGGFSTYSVCMKPADANIDKMDDWMISPVVSLKVGEYELSIDTRYVLNAGKKDVLEIFLGSDATAEAMTQKIATVEATSKDWVTTTVKFTVAADGAYRIGLHAVSEKANSGNLGACNLEVKSAGGDVETVDPPVAGTLSYTLFPKGELKAHVVYTAPTLTKSGAPLGEIAKVQIINRWYEKFDYEDVKPGQVIELDVDLFEGMSNNRLQATAYVTNSKGELVAGDEVLVTGIMGGNDYPLAPQNIKAQLSADRKHVTVSWDAVGEVGENGGYVDVSAVTYYIFDAFGSYYDPALAETTATSYTFDYSDATEPDFIAYQVTAGVGDYYSVENVSDIITYGPALSMPFKESFADGYYESVWVTDLASSSQVMVGTVDDTSLQTNADDPDAEPEYLTSQDGDNGFFYFLPMNKDDMYGMMSLPVNLEGATNPVLEFYVQGKGSAIDVMVGASLPEMKVVKTVDFKQTPTDGWQSITVPLKDYISAGAINFEIRMRAIHNDDDHTWSLPLDNIRVRDLVDNNLAIAAFNVPSIIKVGESTTISGRIENLGAKASTATTATLYRNGAEAGEVQVPALEAGKSAVITFTETATIADPEEIAYSLELTYAADQLPADNKAEAKAKVQFPAHPIVEGIESTIADGAVRLSWSHVSLAGLTEAQKMVEDFENPDYEPLTISDFGGWTMYDLDGGDNYTFLKDEKNPYRTKPCAFQLFNPQLAGVPEDYLIDCEPHSGSTMLVGWSTDGYNSNLLISPELSGKAQTVTFWAKSFSIAYGEEFAVYTSTTGKEIVDFTEFRDIEGEFVYGYVPEEWTQYTLALPEGTKYFSILHNSYDSYALYLDDFTFDKASVLPADTEHLGYNVYRNGVKVNEATVEEAEYVDASPLAERSNEITYHVTAVYNNAESRLSAPHIVDATTLGIIDLEINGVDGKADYYRIDGVKVPANSLTPGLYIMVKDGKAIKANIK